MATPGLRLAAATLALSAIGLVACGDDAPSQAPTETESPDGDGQAESLTDEEGHERIAHFLGVSEERAMEIANENHWTLRVGRRGEETFMLTEDHVIGRITVELDSEDGGDTWRVTAAKVEVDSGQVMDAVQPS